VSEGKKDPKVMQVSGFPEGDRHISWKGGGEGEEFLEKSWIPTSASRRKKTERGGKATKTNPTIGSVMVLRKRWLSTRNRESEPPVTKKRASRKQN